MMKLNIFIYRPDRAPHKNINPDMCYTHNGQPYRGWQIDQEEAYQYKVELMKRKLNQMPDYKVLDYWR